MENLEVELERHFGHAGFRSGQRQVVEALLGLVERIPLLAEGLDLSPPQLEGGFLLPLGR